MFASRPVSKTSSATSSADPSKVLDHSDDTPIPARVAVGQQLSVGSAERKAPTGGLAAVLFANRSAKTTAAPNDTNLNSTASVSAAATPMPSTTAEQNKPLKGLAAVLFANRSAKTTVAPNDTNLSNATASVSAAATPMPSTMANRSVNTAAARSDDTPSTEIGASPNHQLPPTPAVKNMPAGGGASLFAKLAEAPAGTTLNHASSTPSRNDVSSRVTAMQSSVVDKNAAGGRLPVFENLQAVEQSNISTVDPSTLYLQNQAIMMDNLSLVTVTPAPDGMGLRSPSEDASQSTTFFHEDTGRLPPAYAVVPAQRLVERPDDVPAYELYDFHHASPVLKHVPNAAALQETLTMDMADVSPRLVENSNNESFADIHQMFERNLRDWSDGTENYEEKLLGATVCLDQAMAMFLGVLGESMDTADKMEELKLSFEETVRKISSDED